MTNRFQSSSSRRRGFTFVELTMALAMTALVGMVTAGFMLATGQAWRDGGDEQALRLSVEATMTRVAPNFQSAPRILCVTAQGAQLASVFYWAGDGTQGLADRLPQGGELALMEFDWRTGTLWLYKAKPTANFTSSELAEARYTVPESMLALRSTIDTFKAVSWVQARPLYGTGTLVTNPAASRMTALTFTDVPAAEGSKPGIDLSMTWVRGARSVTQNARVCLRAPVAVTSN